MARFTTNLSVSTPSETINVSKSGDYNVAIKINTEVDESDSFIDLVSSGKTVGQNTLRGCKALLIKNAGLVGA